MENKVLSATDQRKPVNPLQNTRRADRVDECVYPGNVSCRGCSYSYRPDLYDGGCKLYFERIQQQRAAAAKTTDEYDKQHAAQLHDGRMEE